MSVAISEAASKKRGRPTAFSDPYVKTLAPRNVSRRTQLNFCHALHAAGRLWKIDERRFAWLADKANTKWKGAGWKPQLLALLDMIQDDEELASYADSLCQDKPKTKLGLAIIRTCLKGVSA